MTLDYFKQALNHIGKNHFGRLWPEESIKTAHPEVADLSDKAIAAAAKRIFVELSPSSFPALKRVIDIAKEEQIKINVSMSPSDSPTRQQNDAQPVINRKGIGSIGLDSLKLIQGILGGKLTKENLIEGMMIFDKKYPRCGWASEAGSLAAHFSRQELEAQI